MTDRAPSALSSILIDEEILQFTKERGLNISEAKRVGSLAGERLVKRCYFLRLTDGQKLKVRRLRSSERAQEVEAILRVVGHPCFPAVLARRGSLLLEPWIEGLRIDPQSAEVAERCGFLLGEFHARSFGEATSAETELPVKEQMTRLENAVQLLSVSQMLSDEDHRTLLATARRYQPDTAERGYIHGDFAPENIVADPQGKFVVVDNELVQEHPYDFDLARTWIRWPMTAQMKTRFLETYRSHRRTTSFQQSVHFWLLCALTRAVAFRVENAVTNSKWRLDQLRLLVREADADPETLLFAWNSDV